MNTVIKIKYYLLSFFVLSGSLIKAQDERAYFSGLSSDVVHEQLTLITDRDLYLNNENICFKAFYSNNIDDKSVSWSKVLYVELIHPDGRVVVQSKYPLNDKGAMSEIDIPGEIISGTYYLKAYTKWMRNFPVNNYAYRKVKIVNTDHSEVQDLQNEATKHLIQFSNRDTDNRINISTDKSVYSSRQEVHVTVQPKSKLLKDATYTVLVVKDDLHSSQLQFATVDTVLPEYSTARFLPETNGFCISGRVLNQNFIPLEGAKVHMAMLGDNKLLSSFVTKDNGEFYFNMPRLNNDLELYFKAQLESKFGLYLEFDPEFCTKPVNLPSTSFSLDSIEYELVNQLNKNLQIGNAYKADTELTPLTKDSSGYSFYGEPSVVYYTKKYIELPNVAEFLFELVPEVSVKYKNKIPEARLSHNDPFSPYKMFYLIDNIPVSDEKAFLLFDLNKVERIEVIDKGYINGDLKYGGVVSIFTYNNDMGGFDLPESAVFTDYHELEVDTELFYTVPSKARIPDRRSVLYMQDNLVVDSENQFDFSFNTSDVKGTYKILVYSLSKEEIAVAFNEAAIQVR